MKYRFFLIKKKGLWSARNFNYTTIQNFYFPNPYTFSNITSSLRFTTANTKGTEFLFFSL
jgi:hypothetical protein